MKKRIFTIIKITIIFTILIIVILLFNIKKTFDIGEFDLSEYQWAMENFSSDKNVGKTEDANTAIEKAKELWIEKFGVVNGKPYDPTQGRRVNVAYDTENECWLIQGTLPSNVDGSVPHALIQKNGKVLAIWFP